MSHTAPNQLKQCGALVDRRCVPGLQSLRAKTEPLSLRLGITQAVAPCVNVQTSQTLAPHIASDTIRISQTPFGKGLLTCKHVPTDQRILSVPFEHLLLLPPIGVDLSTNKVVSKYFKNHGALPDQLLLFLTKGQLLQPLRSI